MNNYNFKKSIFVAAIFGLVIGALLGTIDYFFGRMLDVDLLYRILRISLIMNFMFLAFPYIFRYAAKDKEKKEE